MSNSKVKRMVGIAVLMAVVVVLQLLGQFIRFGPVSISLVLLPIVVGAAVYGPGAGAILGATFCANRLPLFYTASALLEQLLL